MPEICDEPLDSAFACIKRVATCRRYTSGMPDWRLSIRAATAPATRAAALRRVALRQRAAIGASGALVATCVLGWIPLQPPLPGLGWAAGAAGAPDLQDLATVAGAGLLAWHLARLTVSPTARMPESALIAALIAVVSLPGLGAGALLVPILLAFCDGWRRNDQRVVAFLVQCGAILAAAGASGGTVTNGFACAIMLAATGFSAIRPASGAANDNPQMERPGLDSRLPLGLCYDNGDSQPGSGEYGSV